MDWLGLVFVVAGAFALLAAVANWEWYFQHYRVRFLVRLIGRTGARVFYGVLGVALLAAGVLALLGVFHLKR